MLKSISARAVPFFKAESRAEVLSCQLSLTIRFCPGKSEMKFINVVVLVIALGLPAVSCATRLNDTGTAALYWINLILGLVCLGVMMLVLVGMIKGTSKELKSVGEAVASKERLEYYRLRSLQARPLE